MQRYCDLFTKRILNSPLMTYNVSKSRHPFTVPVHTSDFMAPITTHRHDALVASTKKHSFPCFTHYLILFFWLPMNKQVYTLISTRSLQTFLFFHSCVPRFPSSRKNNARAALSHCKTLNALFRQKSSFLYMESLLLLRLNMMADEGQSQRAQFWFFLVKVGMDVLLSWKCRASRHVWNTDAS